MIDNPRSPRVRAVAKLAKRSAREETGLFLVEGPQALREALAFHPELIVDVFATRGAFDRHPEIGRALSRAGLEAEDVTDSVLSAMADTVTPQGVVAVCRRFPVSVEQLLSGGARLVAILEEVRDPGNAGTIIRAADAAGADGVILTGRSVDAYNPKVVRSTTGSIFHLPLAQGGELSDALDAVRAAGMRVLAADISGEELPGLRDELSAPTAWLFGNEAHGLSDETLALADRAVRVPIYGHAESMNLATAASVCLYQSAFAQRG
ncbi:RNA methyltransferase [Homoserinibacter sp. GY 40078]|uniref:TrmH family RNA methyltransferase n=1 Tax=Homoserinibacter sp. GY 40078 TaxID=2603275 RepID=UPI0011C96969|nr:RNA methyltransferase [Homoserinibacter sp. GY 40078]TXK19862.1 RNA methyltransferase [Homoserinibacter sp. GY 40078]